MIEDRRVDLGGETGALGGEQAYDAAAGAAIGMAGRQKQRAEAFAWRGLRLVGSGVDEKNGGSFTQIGQARLFPRFDAACANPLAVGGDAGGNTESRLGRTGRKDVGKKFGVAVGRLDEELRLVFVARTGFQLFEALDACTAVDGKVAVEGKALAVEARRHHGEENARGADQRHDAQAFLLGDGNQVCTGIGHGGAAGLTDHAHILPFAQRTEKRREARVIGVLAHFVEGERVDVDVAVYGFEKASRRADFFDDEVANGAHDVGIGGGEYAVVGRVAEGDRNEVESGHGVRT